MGRQGRPYRDGGDWVVMRELLMAGGRANSSGSYMHPGCLDWAICYPPDEQANRRNFWLWERIDGDGATLEAWAIFLCREGSFDLFVHPSLYDTPRHETIMDEFIGWAEGRAQEDGLNYLWPFWAMADDQVLNRLMRARGLQ